MGKIGINNFHFLEKQGHYDDTASDSLTVVKVRMLKGEECDRIIRNWRGLFSALGLDPNNENRVPVATLWRQWEEIVTTLLDAGSEEVAFLLTDVQRVNAKQALLTSFARNWMANTRSNSYYVHFLEAHLIYLLRTFGSLALISNQGFENSHQTHRHAWQRCTTKGGGRGAVSPIELLLCWQYRLLFTNLHLRARLQRLLAVGPFDKDLYRSLVLALYETREKKPVLCKSPLQIHEHFDLNGVETDIIRHLESIRRRGKKRDAGAVEAPTAEPSSPPPPAPAASQQRDPPLSQPDDFDLRFEEAFGANSNMPSDEEVGDALFEVLFNDDDDDEIANAIGAVDDIDISNFMPLNEDMLL
jgi:hypothetical protein